MYYNFQEADIDELTSHRSDDPRGLRRHKIQASNVPSGHVARRDREYVPMQKTSVSYGSNKKTIDRSPHEVGRRDFFHQCENQNVLLLFSIFFFFNRCLFNSMN